MKQFCPNDIILARFLENRLPDNEKDLLINHLSQCEKCLEKIAEASQLLQDNDVMQWEAIPVSDEKARSVLARTQYRQSTMKDIITKNVNMLKSRVNSIATAFHDWKNQFSIKGNAQFAFVPVRSDSTELLDERDVVVKHFDAISLQFRLISQKSKHYTIQVKPVKKDHSFDQARLYLKHDDGRLISTRPLMVEPIVFESLVDGNYIIEIICNTEKITFEIDIQKGKIFLANEF